MAKRLNVELAVKQDRGIWVALGRFYGQRDFEVSGRGSTLPDALRVLAEQLELYFEHHQEADHG